jgi:hypothetical protein
MSYRTNGVYASYVTGFIRMYKNGSEVKSKMFKGKANRKDICSLWINEVKNLTNKSEFQISYELIL